MKTLDRICWSAVPVVALIGIATFAGVEWKKREALAARAAAEPWRDSGIWRGTALVPAPSVAIPAPVACAFANDPQAPPERTAMFAAFLKPSARYQCGGWFGTITAVEPLAEGWEVTVEIG